MPKKRGQKPPELLAQVAPGLEKVALQEMKRLGFRSLRPLEGLVELRGSPLRANRLLSIPERLLMPLTRFSADNFQALLKGAASVDWQHYGGCRLRISARRSRLYHSGAVAERLRTVIPEGPGQLWVRLNGDLCTFSIDSSGEALHKRGWRLEGGAAPLRETLAAGLLALAGWRPGEALYDPMCGSGTLLIEAARAAAGQAPGSLRGFACESWWRTELPPKLIPQETLIQGSDRSGAALGVARANAQRAGRSLALSRCEAQEAQPPAERGLLICNPPYDRRAGGGEAAFEALAALLKGPFRAWRAAILCPKPAWASLLERPIEARHPLRNGGVPVELLLLSSSAL